MERIYIGKLQKTFMREKYNQYKELCLKQDQELFKFVDNLDSKQSFYIASRRIFNILTLGLLDRMTR